MNSQVADPRWRASIDPPLTPLPIPLTKDHHCCKKTAHGRRSRFLHKLLRGNDGNREVGEPKCDCPGPQRAGEEEARISRSPSPCKPKVCSLMGEGREGVVDFFAI